MFRELLTLAEDRSLGSQHVYQVTQLPVTPAPEDPMPSSGLGEHLHTGGTDTPRVTDINKNKSSEKRILRHTKNQENVTHIQEKKNLSI